MLGIAWLELWVFSCLLERRGAVEEDADTYRRAPQRYRVSRLDWTTVLAGALLAAKQLNERGGVLGRPVELVARDGRSDRPSLPRVRASWCACRTWRQSPVSTTRKWRWRLLRLPKRHAWSF